VKKDALLSEYEQLKIIYSDLIDGYSLFSEKGIYVKHFCEKSYAKIIQRKASLLEFYKKEGIPFAAEREKEVLEDGSWTQASEDRILQLKYILSDNEKYANGLVIESQKAMILGMLEKDRKELKSLIQEKEEILGPTCERYADKELDNYYVYELFYKDPELKNKYFSMQDFEALDIEELQIYKMILNLCLSRVKDEDIKKLSCMPFFLNSFSLVKDRPEKFLDKPVHALTFNQHNLLSSGLRNLSILNQSEGTPPSLIDSKLDELVNWYDQQYSVISSRNKNQSAPGQIDVKTRDVVKQ